MTTGPDASSDNSSTGAVARRGISASAAVGLLSMVANLVLLPLIVSAVGAAPYGYWLVLVVVANCLQYLDFGIGTAMVHFGSRSRAGGELRRVEHFVAAGLVWNLAMLPLVLAVYFAIAWWFIPSTGGAHLSAADGYALIALGALGSASFVLKPYSSALIAAGAMPTERRYFATGVVVRAVGTVVACLWVQSVVAVAIAEASALLVPHVLAWVTVRRRYSARPRLNRAALATLRPMLSYSLRSFRVALAGALLLQGGTLISGLVLGAADATYFNAAFRIYSSIRQLFQWTTDPFRSVLSRLFAVRPGAALTVVNDLCFVTLVSAVAVGIPVALLSPEIVRLWLGSEVPVTDIAWATALLVLGVLANAIHIPLQPAGDGSGHPGAFAGPQWTWLAGFVPLALWWGRDGGIVGVAAALTAPLVVVEPWCLAIAHYRLGLRLQDWFGVVLRPVLLAASGGLVVGAAAFLVLMDAGRGRLVVAAAAFVLGFVLTGLLFRSTIRWHRVPALLHQEM